jgi:hypothetical protein
MPKRVVVVLALALGLAGTGTQTAQALDEPKVPEQVGAYFATGLVPRLADLYGPGAKAGTGIDFDETTKVGVIRRVLSWTGDFLAGKKTDSPTELTNNWIAPITIKQGQVVGLATVWINPSSDLPELADFDPGPALVAALAAAPASTLLIRDEVHSAWFATDGTTITPLVAGTSGVTFPTTPAKYQKTIEVSTTDAAAQNQGLLIAAVVLGVVVVILGGFILLPDRRRRARKLAAVETADTGVPVLVAVAEPASAPVARPRTAAKPSTPAKSAATSTTSATAGKPAVPTLPRSPKAAAPRKKPATSPVEPAE